MTTNEQFYRDVLPPLGEYYIAVSAPGSKLQQRKFDDIESLIAATELLKGRDANIYFATGTFKGNRTISDVQEKKCYYIDVDFGSDNKVYKNAHEALSDIKENIASGDLPRPSYIVFTGHGFHLYWVLEEAISASDWLVGARALKDFCKDNGIHADHGITGDVARILRAPGSKNVKNPDDVKEVGLSPRDPDATILRYPKDLFREGAAEFEELGKYVDAADLTTMPVTDARYSAVGVVKNCGIFRRSLVEGGANDTGEVWGNELLVLTFTEDGEKIKHAIGKNHPDYSPASTEEKWRIKQDCGAKPTTCSFFSGLPNCADVCAACPHSVTTPLHLGRLEDDVQVVEPPAPLAPAGVPQLQLPTDYLQNKNGLWKVTGHDEDGKPIMEPVLPPQMNKQVVDLTVSKNTNYSHHFVLTMKETQDFNIVFTGKQISEGQTWDALLADKRMPLNEPFRKRFRSFIMSWIGQLTDCSVRYGQTHFGWSEDHTAFAVGDEVYKDGNTHRNDMADKVMQDKYKAMGSLENWRARANAVIGDREASAAIIAASLAAPLIGFTRDPGCVLSIHGDSGTGKTTVMKIGQTLWGHPIKSMMSLDDTALSMLNALGIMKNLPAFWDEVRSSSADERLMQTVFRLTAGRERSRLTQSVEQREVHEWQTILITSSNISALGTIASQTRDSDAGIMRVFELTMPPIANSLPDLSCNDCYGLAGRMYGEYLANNHDSVRQQVAKAEESIRAALGAHEPERFRVSLVAALVAGAQLGNSVLGLNFDIKALVNYLRMEFIKLRASSKQHRESYSAEALLIQYISEKTAHRLLTDKMAGRGKHTVNVLTFPKNNNPVYVHVAQDGKCLINKPDFDDYVEKKVGLKAHKTKEEMLKVGGVNVGQRSLGSGTAFAAPRGMCYGIDMTAANFSGVFDSLYQPVAQAANVTSISS